MIDADELSRRFTYHQPKDDQPIAYEEIRRMGKDFAAWITANCPPSRETSLSVTAIEEAVMWANAAIARRS